MLMGTYLYMPASVQILVHSARSTIQSAGGT
jgi:hypothetical protein